MKEDEDRTASLLTPAKLAQLASKPKAPANPSDWLDKMATDAGHSHVRRLAELRADLQVQAAKRDFAPLASDLEAVAAALPQLDFGLLQNKGGLLSRLSGKTKSAVVEFAGQYDRVEAALDELARQGKLLQGRHGEQSSTTDKTLVEFEVEMGAIGKIIDQGARWLQDMRDVLKAREAQAGDEEAKMQVRGDVQRCELLVARLKLLRTLSTAAQESHQQAQAAALRRAGIVQKLQGTVSARVKEWRSRVEPLANAARDGDSPGLSLGAPMDCHRELQLAIKDAAADCAQLQSHEKSLAQSLDALAAPLQDAG